MGVGAGAATRRGGVRFLGLAGRALAVGLAPRRGTAGQELPGGRVHALDRLARHVGFEKIGDGVLARGLDRVLDRVGALLVGARVPFLFALGPGRRGEGVLQPLSDGAAVAVQGELLDQIDGRGALVADIFGARRRPARGRPGRAPASASKRRRLGRRLRRGRRGRGAGGIGLGGSRRFVGASPPTGGRPESICRAVLRPLESRKGRTRRGYDHHAGGADDDEEGFRAGFGRLGGSVLAGTGLASLARTSWVEGPAAGRGMTAGPAAEGGMAATPEKAMVMGGRAAGVGRFGANVGTGGASRFGGAARTRAAGKGPAGAGRHRRHEGPGDDGRGGALSSMGAAALGVGGIAAGGRPRPAAGCCRRSPGGPIGRGIPPA